MGPAAGVGQPGCRCWQEKRNSHSRGNPQGDPTLRSVLLGEGQVTAPVLQIRKQTDAEAALHEGTQHVTAKLGLKP